MLKFPEEIIRDAKQKAKELEKFEELKPKKDGEGDDEEEEDEEEGRMEEERAKNGGMEVEEDDLISFAKRATLQMKHKVIQLVQKTVEDSKNLKSAQEKKNALQQLVQQIKRIEFES